MEALLRQTDVVFRNKTECADFLTERQMCAGISSPVTHDACQVKNKTKYKIKCLKQ